MPLIDIQPQRFRKIQYDAPQKGKVEIKVDANAAIDIFIVPASRIDAWKRRSSEYGGDGFLRRKHLELRVNIGPEFEDGWYLVLDNQSDRAVTANYEVYEL